MTAPRTPWPPTPRRFAATHAGVLVLSRPDRGGKSSAMNFALRTRRPRSWSSSTPTPSWAPMRSGKSCSPWPMRRSARVAGSIVVRNPFASLATWLQAYEYLSTIFVGRMTSALFNILGIVSGAFGAFRRYALEKVHGWDVGPPEDLDLTLALRKAGYRKSPSHPTRYATPKPRSLFGRCSSSAAAGTAAARFAITSASTWTWLFPGPRISASPTSGPGGKLVFQRVLPLRHCGLVYLVLSHLARRLVANPVDPVPVLSRFRSDYGLHQPVLLRPISAATCWLSLVFFLMPLYQCALMIVRLIATTEEILFRTSFTDNYVPEKVRKATWHW